MMRTKWMLLLAVGALAAGCKSKDENKAKPAPSSAPPTTTGPAAGSATVSSGSAAGSATSDDRCATPCRFLADTPLADIAAKVKSTCASEWPATSPSDCGQLDYLRNCVFATAGYTFKKKRYQKAFGTQPWYKARADFKDKDLSAVATANVAELKKSAAQCRKADVVEAKDKKIAEAWLDKLLAGKPEVPAILIGETSGESLLANKAQYAKAKLKGYSYQDPTSSQSWRDALQGKKVRLVNLNFSEPEAPDCDEDCEGFGVWLVLAIDDKDQVIGVEQEFAACPFVYLVTDSGPILQGEILRNLNSHLREGTQPLAVSAPCSGHVTYRISEEKDEITHLDELALVIDGEVIAPDACVASSGAICANDGLAHVMRKGDTLEATFTVPADLQCNPASLRANGYYVPTH